jgi:Family of unknown function (DUF6615)
MVREALVDVLLDRAAWTHARLDAGRRHGVELHEETITQDLLLDIAQALPGLVVRTFTRMQESRLGADWQWDWWFHGYRWFGLRLQAKRLKLLKSGVLGYDLGYLVGRQKRRQVDLLIDGARGDGLEAAYVLYNGPDLDLKFDWLCRSMPPSPAFFGVSVLPAAVARLLVNAKTVDLPAVGRHSRPWSCLVDCDPFGGCLRRHDSWPPWPPYPPWEPIELDLATWVASSFYRLVLQQRYGNEWGTRQENALRQRVDRSIRAEAPEYVYGLLDAPNDVDRVMPPGVRAVTIVDTTASGA